MAKRTSKMSDRLAKLQKKLTETDVGGGGGEGFWSPPEGDSVIRILPEVGDMDFFFQEVGQHRLPDGEYIKCPNFTSSDEYDCPICELVSVLWKGSDEDKDLARSIKVNKRYWMNIVVRDKDDDGGDTGTGPYIFTPGVTIFRAVVNLINNPDYGDITDLEEGTDLILSKSTGKEKWDVDYQLVARRYDSPLHTDEDQIENWLDDAADVSFVMLSDDPAEDNELGEGAIVKLLPYNRMIDKFGIDATTPTQEVVNRKSNNSRSSKTEEPAQKAKAVIVKEEALATTEDEVGSELRAERTRRRSRRK